MPRVPFLDESSAPVSAETLETLKRWRGGKLLEIDRLTIHKDALALGWVQLFAGLAAHCSIGIRIREIALLRVGVLTRARYELHHHRRIARAKASMTEAEIDAVADWQGATCFSEKERAVLAYTDAMTETIQVPKSVFSALRAHFGDGDLVELTANIAGYNMICRFMEALELVPEA